MVLITVIFQLIDSNIFLRMYYSSSSFDSMIFVEVKNHMNQF